MLKHLQPDSQQRVPEQIAKEKISNCLEKDWRIDLASTSWQSITAIAASLPRVFLNLSFNKIEPEQLAALSDFIKNARNLFSLNLCATALDDKAIAQLAMAISKSSALTILDVSNLQLQNLTVQLLLSTVNDNKDIKVLILGDPSMNDGIVAAICKKMTFNTSLRALKLWNCSFSDEGAKSLALFIEKNRTLSTLCLGHNALEDKHVHVLTQAMHKNNTLHTLDLHFNNISHAGAQLLKECQKTPIIEIGELTTVDTILEKRMHQGLDAFITQVAAQTTKKEEKKAGKTILKQHEINRKELLALINEWAIYDKLRKNPSLKRALGVQKLVLLSFLEEPGTEGSRLSALFPLFYRQEHFIKIAQKEDKDCGHNVITLVRNASGVMLYYKDRENKLCSLTHDNLLEFYEPLCSKNHEIQKEAPNTLLNFLQIIGVVNQFKSYYPPNIGILLRKSEQILLEHPALNPHDDYFPEKKIVGWRDIFLSFFGYRFIRRNEAFEGQILSLSSNKSLGDCLKKLGEFMDKYYRQQSTKNNDMDRVEKKDGFVKPLPKQLFFPEGKENISSVNDEKGKPAKSFGS